MAEQPKVTVYWLEQSRAQRLLWLLEELDIKYELKVFHRDKKLLAPPELKEVHPLGKSPLISIESPDGGPQIVLAESGVIFEYLLDHFAGPEGNTLLPKRYAEGQEGKIGGETQEWMRYKYFMHYSEGSLMGYLVVSLIASRIKTSRVPFFIRPITSAVANGIQTDFLDQNFVATFSFLEDQIKTSGGDYLCGPGLTGADIIMSYPLIAARIEPQTSGMTDDKYPKLCEYIDRLQAEPAYKRAVDRVIEIEGKYEPIP